LPHDNFLGACETAEAADAALERLREEDLLVIHLFSALEPCAPCGIWDRNLPWNLMGCEKWDMLTCWDLENVFPMVQYILNMEV
jgi:hypothetical protein